MDAPALLGLVQQAQTAPAVFKIGKVSASYSSGRPALRFDGESSDTVAVYPYLNTYTPAANDRVLVAIVGSLGVVLGRIT
jgi:hypothetical protein